MPTPTHPLTIEDWLFTAQDAERLGPELLALFARLEHSSPPSAWVTRVSLDVVRQRVTELESWRAQVVDWARVRSQWPLFGVPFAVKDNIDAAGLPTTAGCEAHRHVPAVSATVVHKLINAGAVLMGKANLDQFATGLVGTRSPYGAPSSVFDVQRISGGSSSGSAVLVASGALPFALGTDTAGSGRIPAGFNNIVGLKPTPGRVSTTGVLPACRSLDCVSVFALTVDDAATVLSVIEGADETDAYSAYCPGRFEWPQRIRVGVPIEPRLDDGVGYPQAWRAAWSQMEAMGCDVVPMELSGLHAIAALLYEGPWVAERYAAIESLIESQPHALDATVASVIGQARSMTAVQAFRGQYALQEGRVRAREIWRRVDALMVPTAPGHPTHQQVQAEPVGANAALGHYTNFVNLLGWSALAMPAGFTAQGLPFGVTFIAPEGSDAALVQLGRRWQADGALPLGATDRRAAPAAPQLPLPAAEPTMRLAVVGAHLSGLPLNWQLTKRRAVLREVTTTAPHYRLCALPNTSPRKPGMQRVAQGGHAIAIEVWEMPVTEMGSLLQLISSPLGLGSVELADGSQVCGFVCEAYALDTALDVSRHGGWRNYLASLG